MAEFLRGLRNELAPADTERKRSLLETLEKAAAGAIRVKLRHRDGRGGSRDPGMISGPWTVDLGIDVVKPAQWHPVADVKPEQATIEAL